MFTGVAGVLTFWRGRFCRLFEKTVMIGIVRLFVFLGLFRWDRSIHRSIENPGLGSKYEGSGVFG